MHQEYTGSMEGRPIGYDCDTDLELVLGADNISTYPYRLENALQAEERLFVLTIQPTNG